MKKIAIVTHYYHKKTSSINILVDELFKNDKFIVDYFYLYNQTSLEFDQNLRDYDAVIIVQLISLELLNKIQCDNIIFIPMYDLSCHWDIFKWLDCVNLKVLSLTKKTHDALCSIGINSYYIKYYPQPVEFIPGDLKKVFLWQRINEININTTLSLLKNLTVDQIHIHKAIDPYNSFKSPQNINTNIKFTFSDWFENKEHYLNILKEYGIYIAPRLREGGASAFIDAMKMGKIIIANDDSAMNEYIIHNETGFLYNIKKIKPIDFNSVNLKKIQMNSFQSIHEGRASWIKSIPDVLDYIESKNDPHISTKLIRTIQDTHTLILNDLEQLKISCYTMESNINHDNLCNFAKTTIRGKAGTIKNFIKQKLIDLINVFNKKTLLSSLGNFLDEVNVIIGNLEIKNEWITSQSPAINECQCIITPKKKPKKNFKLSINYAFIDSQILEEQHLSLLTGYKGDLDNDMIAIFLHFTVEKKTHLYLRKNQNGSWVRTEVLINSVADQGNLEVIKKGNKLQIRCNDSRAIVRKFEPNELKGNVGVRCYGAHFRNFNVIELWK